jgi:hypothetical protein
LEEDGNCGARIPAPKQRKCWENVFKALKSCGKTSNNYCTIQHHFMDLKGKFVAEQARKEATAGVEDFGNDDNPFS